jgi:hypothetical protein
VRHQRTLRTIYRDSRQPERSPEKDSLEHFERFCYHLKLPDTLEPLRLEEWQLGPLRDYFEAPALEHLWMWPTGMGKSCLLGALALHHATFVRINPRVIVLGGLGRHGQRTLSFAAWFISQSKTLQSWWVFQEYGMGRIKSLIQEDAEGTIEVSSAGRRVGGRGGSSQEGEAPSLVVVEELHRHEDDGGAVRTLTTKIQKRTVGAHRVRIVHVTTAGDSMDSPLGRMCRRATAPGSKVVQSGYHRRAEDPDGDLILDEWAVPEEIEPPAQDAPRAEVERFIVEVKKANPASFIDPASLRRIWKASSAEPWVFARQNMNQWITGYAVAFNRLDWLAGQKKRLVIPAGERDVFVGLDTATAWATTAVVPVWIDPASGRPRTAGGVIRKSTQEGTRRRMRDVLDVIQAMHLRWPTMRLVFDRNQGGGLIAEMLEEDEGLTVIDHSQGTPMDLASMLLGELIGQQMLDHDGREEISAQVLAAVARSTYHGTRWRIEPPRTKEPVDAAVALAMALHVAWQQRSEKPLDPADYRIEGI